MIMRLQLRLRRAEFENQQLRHALLDHSSGGDGSSNQDKGLIDVVRLSAESATGRGFRGLSSATQQQLLLGQLLGLQSSLALFYRNAKRKSTQAEELVKVIKLTEEARGKTNPAWWEKNKMKPLKDRKRKLECERELLIRGHETAKQKLQPLWRAVQKLVTPSVILVMFVITD